MDFVKMTNFTLLVKLEILNGNFCYESVTLKLIQVKRKVSAKSVLQLFFTSFRFLRSKSWTRSLDQERHIVAETQAKNCSESFCNQLKEKDWKLSSASMTSNAIFRSIALYILMKSLSAAIQTLSIAFIFPLL